MPVGKGYPTEKGDTKPGVGAGPVSNAADVRKAGAPKGSVAERIEASMKAGEGPAQMAAPYDGNTIWRPDFSTPEGRREMARPQSPSASSHSRNRRGHKRFFDEVKGNK